MNVLIINGAKRNGNTAKLTERFAEGAREAGHTTETVQLFGKKISGCVDCQHCQTSGACVWKDDAPAILEQALTADVLVFASPVYYYGISGQLKTLLDRFYAYHAQVKNKRVYFAVSSAAAHDETYGPKLDLAEASIRGWVDCFGDDVTFEGTFGAWGMFEANVEETPAWGASYEAGRKLS